ncbi:hypothetical protein N9189_04115 [Pirellulaceae bacterium]|jgi:hypothetical protein|nr:hypothetical protein [Pirellulaceae bacterium]
MQVFTIIRLHFEDSNCEYDDDCLVTVSTTRVGALKKAAEDMMCVGADECEEEDADVGDEIELMVSNLEGTNWVEGFGYQWMLIEKTLDD